MVNNDGMVLRVMIGCKHTGGHDLAQRGHGGEQTRPERLKWERQLEASSVTCGNESVGPMSAELGASSVAGGWRLGGRGAAATCGCAAVGERAC